MASLGASSSIKCSSHPCSEFSIAASVLAKFFWTRLSLSVSFLKWDVERSTLHSNCEPDWRVLEVRLRLGPLIRVSGTEAPSVPVSGKASPNTRSQEPRPPLGSAPCTRRPPRAASRVSRTPFPPSSLSSHADLEPTSWEVGSGPWTELFPRSSRGS